MSELQNEIDALRQTLIEKEIHLVEEKYEDQLEKINATLEKFGNLLTYYGCEITQMKTQLEEFLDDDKDPINMIISERKPFSYFKPRVLSLLSVISVITALYCAPRR